MRGPGLTQSTIGLVLASVQSGTAADATARAIVNRPSILTADEPTGNLDQEYADTIMELFKSFNLVGVTVLLSTHDEAALGRLTCRRIALDDGKLAT